MKKLLIWDGDDSLWNGTIVENNVSLPQGRFELCQELCRRGVIQSIASKNKIEDVLFLLEKWNLTQFFVIPEASFFLSKTQMIQNIATNLNLSKLSDVIFIDDLVLNREEIKQTLSQIECFHPKDIQYVVDTFFSKDSYTEDDSLRVRRYKEEAIRKQASQSYNNNYQEFLRECKLQLNISKAIRSDFERLFDLIKRSNRMSILSKEFSEQEILESLNNIYIGQVSDKFGDYGLSAIIMIENNFIKIFVVSCRLQGKGIGSAILGYILNQNINKEIQIIYNQTEYNQGMKGLLDWYKFINKDKNIFSKFVDKEVELPSWLTINFEQRDFFTTKDEKNILIRKMKTEEKQQAVELVNKTNDKILMTFDNLWTEREYWEKYTPLVAIHDNRIIGIHVYTINDKYKEYCKSYYLVVDSLYRGLGIGVRLFELTLKDAKQKKCFRYFTNSDIKNDGVIFYKNLGIKPVAKKQNQFNSYDLYFDFWIKNIESIEDIKNKTLEFYPSTEMMTFYKEECENI